MRTIEDVKRERLAAVRTARGFAERLANGEQLTAAEQRDYAAVNADVDILGTELEHLQANGVDAAIEATVRRTGNPYGSRTAEVRYGRPLPAGGKFADLPDARGNQGIEGFGRWCRSILTTGYPPRDLELRAMSEGVDASGGYLVPTIFGAPILDLTVAKMVTNAARARIVPMDVQNVKLARLDADPSPAWRNEGAAIAESDATFGQVSLTARSLAVYTKVSLELLEDSPQNFEQVLADSFARAFALELDRVALYDTGTAPQPRGLKNVSGVNTTNFTGANGGTLAATNYQALLDTVSRLKVKNYTPSAIVYAPRTEAQIAGLKNTANEPIILPEYFRKAAPHLVSGQIPVNLTLGTSNDTSDLLVGDFSNLFIGLRTSFSVMALREPLMLSAGQIALVGWLRADAAVARTGAFEILNGLRA